MKVKLIEGKLFIPLPGVEVTNSWKYITEVLDYYRDNIFDYNEEHDTIVLAATDDVIYTHDESKIDLSFEELKQLQISDIVAYYIPNDEDEII